jgi:hypothetical protein
MTDIELELRRLLEAKGQEVTEQTAPTSRLLRRVRRARLVVPTAVIAIASASVLAFTSLPFTRSLDRIPMPAERDGDAQPLRDHYFVGDAPMSIAGGEDGLWVAGLRINFVNLDLNLSTSSELLGATYEGAAYGMDRFWVVVRRNTSHRLLSARLEDGDPRGARGVEVSEEIAIEDGRQSAAHFMAVGHGYVWMSSGGARVHRYDPTARQIETFDLNDQLAGFHGDQGALWVASGDRYVWFANVGGRVAAFDPVTMAPGPTIDLRMPGSQNNWQIAGFGFTDGHVVILRSSARGVQQIWQMDETEEGLQSPIRLGRWSPTSPLNVEGPFAYLLRSHSDRKVIVNKVALRSGALTQRKATLDSYTGFTVFKGNGWVGDLVQQEVLRVPLPQ